MTDNFKHKSLEVPIDGGKLVIIFDNVEPAVMIYERNRGELEIHPLGGRVAVPRAFCQQIGSILWQYGTEGDLDGEFMIQADDFKESADD